MMNIPGLNVTAYGGDYCPAGTYCKPGSTATTPCDAGHFCPVPLMTALNSTNKCRAGYYCDGGANTSTPEGLGGNICPPGHYCP
jgi:hypothetical protein